MNKNDSWVLAILVAAILMLVAQIFKLDLLMAVSFPVVFFAWLWLGTLRKGVMGSCYKKSFLALLVIWVISFVAMNLIDTKSMFDRTILGFPVATAIMVYIVWLLPLFVGTLAYGLRFETDYLGEEEIQKVADLVGHKIDLNL